MKYFNSNGWFRLLFLGVAGCHFAANGQTLSEALNNTNLIWRTGGSGGWFSQSAVTHDGVAAIQNLNTAEMSDTWIETTVTGPGTIEYWWKVADYIFSLQINGVETTNILWNVDWNKAVLPVPAGSQTLRWNFFRGPSWQGVGNNICWLDQVTFTPSPPAIILNPTNAPSITTNQQFSFGFITRSNASYAVQYVNSLTNTNWLVLTNILGNGKQAPVLDPSLIQSNRYYRIEMQSSGDL